MTEVEFYTKPVLGFRSWKIDTATLRLTGMAMQEEWPYRMPQVSSHWTLSTLGLGVPEGESPRCLLGKPCGTCGMYAFHTYEDVCEHQKDAWMHLGNVRGVVAGWGRVVLCENGWRAGKAYPLALLDWNIAPSRAGQCGVDMHDAIERTALRYRIPIVPTVDDLKAIAEAKGIVPAFDFGVGVGRFTTTTWTLVPEDEVAARLPDYKGSVEGVRLVHVSYVNGTMTGEYLLPVMARIVDDPGWPAFAESMITDRTRRIVEERYSTERSARPEWFMDEGIAERAARLGHPTEGATP